MLTGKHYSVLMATTLTALLGFEGGVQATVTTNDVTISSGRSRKSLPYDQWLTTKRSMRALLPEGTLLYQAENPDARLAVHWDGSVPSLVWPNGTVWQRLSGASAVVTFFHDCKDFHVILPEAQ